MQTFLKKAILRLFPELTGGLHLDRYSRVLAVADDPDTGSSSERFRPRLAVDIEILTPDLEPDPEFPQYTAIPLPVPIGSGQEAGIFSFPRPGAIVVVGFAYGRQDHPVIRQIYSLGDSLPQVEPEEMLLQKNQSVFQRADTAGNWIRETDATINDKSVSRLVEAMDSTTELAMETKRISEHSNIEVDGAQTLEVGTQLTMLAGKRADLGTLGEMNLTAGADSTHSTGKNAIETVGENHTSLVKKNRDITVEGERSEDVKKGQTTTIGDNREESVGKNQTTTVGESRKETVGKSQETTIGESRKETVGMNQTLDIGATSQTTVGLQSTETVGGNKTISAANIIFRAIGKFTVTSDQGGGGVNLYQELLEALDDIKAALDTLSRHDHPDVGMINQGGIVADHSTDLGRHRNLMDSIVE